MTQDLIDSGIVPELFHLLMHDSVIIRRETCFLISNIFAGSSRQVDALLRDKRIIPILLCALISDEMSGSFNLLFQTLFPIPKNIYSPFKKQ